MYGVTQRFLDALRASHKVRLWVDVYQRTPLVRLYRNVPISGGKVTIDASSQVRRTLDLTVSDPALMPTVNNLLAPHGHELWVLRGIEYPNGQVEWTPLGLFRVDAVNWDVGGGSFSITATDRSRHVADARFEAPRRSNTALTVPGQISQLVKDVISNAAVSDTTGSTTSTPDVTWERDRWEAIEELATSIGAEAYFGASADVKIRKVPAITDKVVWYVDAGETGVMVTGDRALSRESVYNVVVATGESTEGTTPAYGIAEDTDPASPTYIGGQFGRVPRFYASPLLATNSQAALAAATLLEKVRSLNRQLDLSCVPNPALDVGDVIQVRFPDGSVERHILDRIEVPLDATSPMALGTRTSRAEEE